MTTTSSGASPAISVHGARADVLAAGGRHELRRPVAGEAGRIEPLDADDTPPHGGAGKRREPRPHPGHERIGLGLAAERAAGPADVAVHAVERPAREADDLGRPLEDGGEPSRLAVGDGADLAQLLGHDDVRRELGEAPGVHGDDRPPRLARRAHRRVDRAARERRGDRRRRDRRDAGDGGGPVALVRAADQLLDGA
jgi:hypothetical protein